MNDANYIIKNIAMLKRNTINVKNLTNKFCLELSRNFGIERTNELENTISELLTRYKSGEIDDNAVVESFGGILNTPNVENNNITSTSNNINKNISQNSSNNTASNKSVSKDTSKSTIENVESTSDAVDNLSKSENTVDIKEEKNDNSDVEVLDDINKIENDEIKEELSNNVSVNSTIVNTETLNDSELVSDIKQTNNSELEQTVISVSDKDSVTDEALNPIVDIEPSSLADVVSICEGIYGELSGLKITPPAKAMPYATGIIAAAEKITGVSSSLSGFKSIVLATITGAEENDVSYDASELSWDDIAKIYDKSKNSQAIAADVDFFKDKCQVIDDRYAILNIGGKECKYDIKKHQFYVDDKVVLDATIYVPSNNNNYSNLNVYTYFAENSERSKNAIKNREINNISIQIVKSGVDEKGDYLNGAIYTKTEETALLTKFVNKTANTNLGKCKNIISGDSRFGAYALKIAANADNGELYQTVYCVNNAVIVRDLNGNGEKVKITQEELARLDGKDIYFITAAGDDNPAMNTNGLLNAKKYPQLYEKSYLYTGLKIICKTCPNAKIHMVYNDEPAGHDYLTTILKDLEKEFSNYSYDGDKWSDCSRSANTNHHDGPVIVNDLSESVITNYI